MANACSCGLDRPELCCHCHGFYSSGSNLPLARGWQLRWQFPRVTQEPCVLNSIHSVVEAQLVEEDLVDGSRERAEDAPVKAVDAAPPVFLHAALVRRAAALARRRQGRVVALDVHARTRVQAHRSARARTREGAGV